MWQVKKFKTREAMEKFIERNSDRIQYVEVFINQSSLKQPRYAIEYRRLRIIG